MEERRQHTRVDLSIEVIVSWPGEPQRTFHTANSSQGGIFLVAEDAQLPEIGTEIVVTLPEFLGRPKPHMQKALVTHKSQRGIGITFLDTA